MTAALKAAARRLAALRHEELVESPESHSRVSSRSDTLRVGAFEQGLGWRRLWNFRAIHRRELERLLASLQGERAGAEVLAWRGRLLRLLGRLREARESLKASLALAPGAEAAAWLGELAVYHAPKEAAALLDEAARLAPGWGLPFLWKGLSLLKDSASRPALAALERALRVEPRADCHVLRLARGEAYLNGKDFARALKEARRAIRLDPASPAGYHMAGSAAFAAGDLKSATRYADWARDRDMDLEGPFFAALGVVQEWGDPAAYLKDLDKAILKKSPGLAALYAARAELKRHPKLCLYDEALGDYQKAVALAPDCAWVRAVLARAQDYSFGGRAGLESFAAALKLCPQSGWMRAWRGAVWARLGERDRALADFSRALLLMPWYSFTYAWRGALLNRLGRHEEALQDLDTAIGLDPHYPFSFNERFQARRALKDHRGAAADLNCAFAADPKYTWLGASAATSDPKVRAKLLADFAPGLKGRAPEPWLFAWRGYSLLQWGRGPEALKDLDRALALGLKSAAVRAWRGWALLETGRLDEAAAALQEAVRLDKDGWFAYKVLSQVRAAQGRAGEALAAVTRASVLAPTTVPVLLSRARLEHQLGRGAAALKTLGKAAELDRRFGEVFLLRAEIRLAAGQARAAALDVEKALALPSPPGRAYLVRGLIRQKLGDPRGQIEDFKTALASDPGLFQERERQAVEDLIRGGAAKEHA